MDLMIKIEILFELLEIILHIDIKF